CLRGSAEEMGAASPLLIFNPNESLISLMHGRGGLKSLAWRFLGHLVRGEFAQFLVNQRQQFVGSFWIAFFDGVEDAGDVAHFVSPLVFAPTSISALASRMKI